MKLNTNTVVIGAGVAGMTAAIYLKRSNIEVIILEKSAPGGQINRTNDIENYPGFTHIDGPVLAMNIYEQIRHLEIEYKYGDVLTIQDFGDYKIIKTDQEEIICKNIIIASGRRPRELELENENKLTGRGVSYCAICDGPLYKGKITAVVGGGNSAIEEAQYLSGISEKVYLIHRGETFRADEVEQERLFSKTNIEILYNSVVDTLIEENNKLTGIKVKNKDGIEKEFKVDGLFIYIGHEPETYFLKDLPITMNNGYLEVDSRMQTNIDGIYACGDVIKKDVYQISTAVGEATVAALSVKKDMQ
jgi:thioredoxin reductase (NADPH)